MQSLDSGITLAATAPAVLFTIFAVLVGIPLLIVAIIYLVVPTVKGMIWLIRHVFTFIFGMIGDALRLIGTVLTTLILVPLVVGNVLIGRWSASAHYGRAIQGELKTAGRSFYRLAVGHVARLLCLHALTEGIEKRIPEVVAAAPGADRPSKRIGQFDGYTIVGSLPGGGSGGKLYVGKPSEQKLAAFARMGATGVDQVVIKCFTLGDGSSLPQIVRENRALDAAKRLGLILEHDLNEHRFYYVMRYVPGDSLNLVTQRLHAMSGGGGLGRRELAESLEYTADLLRTLAHYHAGGLWHKDVKPDNIIVSSGQAHLVDFGLITPLRSSMTLTTHGTEYFRDPEMVRLALKGVKVQDVDGARFDIYAVGAVLYSVIENSFPAHGGLSQISRTCPEVVRMIVRRAMTDYDKRYASAMDMLADVEAVLRADDPYAMKLFALPSMRTGEEEPERAVGPIPAVQAAVWGQAPVGAGVPPPIPGASRPDWSRGGWQDPAVVGASAGSPRVAPGGRMKPRIRVTNWWRGTYVVEGEAGAGVARAQGSAGSVAGVAGGPGVPWGIPVTPGAAAKAHAAANAAPFGSGVKSAPAAEQLRRARERARAAQERIRTKMHERSRNHASGINAGVVAAIVIFGVLFVGGNMYLFSRSRAPRVIVSGPTHAAPMPVPPVSPDRVLTMPGTSGPSIIVPASDRGGSYAVPEDHHTPVVVLCDWSKYSAGVQDRLEKSLRGLERAGFVLLGDAAPGKTPSADAVEVVAEVRSAIGTRLFLSRDAGEAAQAWASQQDVVPLVMWIAQDPTKGENASPTKWLIGAESVPTALRELASQRME
ncbi:MAG: serine/threonine protein kinase [Phycisphaerales bacterium]